MAMLVASEEEEPHFTNKELLLFYGVIGFMMVFLAFATVTS